MLNRFAAFALALFAAQSLAAPVSGRVESDKGPVAGAVVTVWPAERRLDALCPSAGPKGHLGMCVCRGKADALAKALATVGPAKPLAQTTAGADGTFTLDAEPLNHLIVTSPDGTLGTIGRVRELLAEGVVTVSPQTAPRVKLAVDSGLDASKVSLFAIEYNTGAVVPMKRADDGLWEPTGPVPPGYKNVYAFIPGAHPAMERIGPDGSGTFRGGWPRKKEAPELKVGAFQHFEGVVTKDGKPAAGATVTSEPRGCAYVTRTDAKGRFSFDSGPVPPQIAELVASTPGYLATAYGSPNKPAELLLVKAAQFEGTFVDSAGNPLPGLVADLTWRRADNNGLTTSEVTSDAKGSFKGAFAGTGSVEVRLRERGDWAFTETRKAEVTAGTTTRTKFPLARGATLTVEVVDGGGKPIPKMRVQVFYGEALQTKMSQDMKTALLEWGNTSNARGVVQIPGLLPGEYEVAIDDHKLGKASATGTAPGRIRLQLGDTPVLKVVVTDERGRPFPNVNMNLKRGNDGYGLLTDESGVATIALNPGTYELSTQGEPNETRTVELKEKGITELKLVQKGSAPSSAKLKGIVVDTAGNPVPNAQVFAWAGGNPYAMHPRANKAMAQRMLESMAKHTPSPSMGGAFTADAKGQFTAPTSQRLRFWARADGYAPREGVLATGDEVRVVVDRRPSATGRVLGADGKPVRGVPAGDGTSDQDGRFRTTLYEDGPNQFFVGGAGSGRPPVLVTATATAGGGDVSVGDVKLEDGVTLRGTAVDAVTKQPVERLYLTASWGSGDHEKAIGSSRATGEFQIEGVRARPPVTLEYQVEGYAKETLKLSKTNGPIQLALSPLGSLTLSLNLRGAPGAGVEVKAEGSGDARHYTTDALGAVTLHGLKGGTWTLRFSQNRKDLGAPMTVSLKPGENKSITVER